MSAELNDGQKLIAHNWFCAMHELHDLVHAESPTDRIAAADVMLRYYTSMAQSINSPYIPESDPGTLDEDSDDG